MAPQASNSAEHTPYSSLEDMIQAIISTFSVAHEQDTDAHLAQALVFNAGRLAWRMREQGVQTEYKTSISDVVTDADRAAETFVSGVLAKVRLEDGVLGEEGAQRESRSGRTWVIDPVDGTYNFTSGSDYWCSALALVEGDPAAPETVLLGAVHRPAMGYTWFGGPDTPTTRNGKEVARIADAPAERISVASYLHPSTLNDDAIVAAWRRTVGGFATVRMLGAGSVDLASVADGTVGLWLQHSVKDWDWLPGKALVEAAGGTAQKVDAGGVTWCVAGPQTAVRQVAEALTAHES